MWHLVVFLCGNFGWRATVLPKFFFEIESPAANCKCSYEYTQNFPNHAPWLGYHDPRRSLLVARVKCNAHSCKYSNLQICKWTVMTFVLISQDYPSLAHLHDKLQQSNVLPIFAVVKEVSSLYQVFSDGFVLKTNFNITVIFE